MAALHGRPDPLLDATRFARLLRQANDAEVADVRKVGEDEYEISPHRTGGITAAQPLAPAVTAPAAPPEPAPVEEEAAEPAGARENGQRFGVRFRRGSRAPIRAGEIPLIGVVEVEVPTTSAESVLSEPADEPEPAAAKPVRPRRRAPRKRASATVAATEPADTPQGADAPAPKRPRSRTRKKAAE
jgi:ribonuclease E